MADLSINFAGITSPNPFWLASAPPTNTAYQINKAFEYGWGGAVWKTVGAPVLNVCSRYGGFEYAGNKLVAINNVELISDRPLETNLREIREVKALWPDRAVIVSAMVESKPEAWREIVQKIEDTGADGIELNYGCPHGMSERGMGSAVGQVPEYCSMITEWVTDVASVPVIVKLTPNVTDIVPPAKAAVRGRADAISLINTINSIIGVDLDSFRLEPNVGGKGSHGGYAGPAVKPVALHMLSAVAGRRGRAARSPAYLRHGRYPDLARRGGVFASGRNQPASLHRGHALRLSDYRGLDRRVIKLAGRKERRVHKRHHRRVRSACFILWRLRPRLQDGGPY